MKPLCQVVEDIILDPRFTQGFDNRGSILRERPDHVRKTEQRHIIAFEKCRDGQDVIRMLVGFVDVEIERDEQVERLERLFFGHRAAILAALNGQSAQVSAVEKKKKSRSPAAPFTTSTLQQEAVRKLGMTTDRAMRAAQQLYEGVDVGSGGTILYSANGSTWDPQTSGTSAALLSVRALVPRVQTTTLPVTLAGSSTAGVR